MKVNIIKEQLGTVIREHPKNLILLMLLVLILILLTVAIPDRFLTRVNLESMAFQLPEFGLLALAMMLAMITGGIDLSVVSIANLAGVVAAKILTSEALASSGLSIPLAVVVVFILSAVCGLLNGTLIAVIGVPAILATLGSQGLLLGIAILLTKGHGISGFPDSFMVVGGGSLLGIPIPFLLFLSMAAVVGMILSRTRQGFCMYMVGTNPVVARFSGISNRRVIINTYLMTAILAGLASLIMISRVNSIRPGYGAAYLLQAILVVVLGGVDPKGGFGSVPGVVMGLFILQLTRSGLNILSFSPFFKKFIWGSALLGIMLLNVLVHRYGEFRRAKAVAKSQVLGEEDEQVSQRTR